MMHADTIASALRFARNGQPGPAIATFEKAGQHGDASAMAELATWLLRGDLIPRDLSRARIALRRAVEIGHVDAALLEAALTANGTGGPSDWSQAVTLLKTAAKTDPVAAQQMALLGAMHLNPDGYPLSSPTPEILCKSPYVVRFRGAVTPAECLHIAGVGHPHLEPCVVIDPVTRRPIAHPVRTSFSATIGPAQETLPVAALNRRFATLTRTPLQNGEPLQILKYATGQEYKLHSDAVPGATNQRTVTAIAYLNDGFGGGETDFPLANLRIIPRAGDIIAFTSTGVDGALDRLARHAGLPITSGIKWIATRWIRREAFNAWIADIK
jgi:prolyl 4-hydroxylase